MGLHIEQEESNFFISSSDLPDVICALHEANGNWDWVDSSYKDIYDVEELFNALRWEVFIEDGDVVGIEFAGTKLGDDERIMEVIAPWVADGSYIQMHGETLGVWRWCFESGKCIEKYPDVKWG